ncbi:MipA/OmpV family protein [Roseateles amylovorans]|uniref:MipA/OmpV family protein n=1 Tax=Roseateles amylovorans TaxID=2978473 RepID=A0ABY6AUM5_9BURK|nr:MipA/OmpV family protein [Roseateles amylovorans]UXH76916.1 MipA/OmpV family protein [Roseateles amylovorans]
MTATSPSSLRASPLVSPLVPADCRAVSAPSGQGALPSRRSAPASASPLGALTPWFATAALVAGAAFSGVAHAQGQPREAAQAADEGGSGWALGLGVGLRQQPYAGAERKTNVLPLVYYENRWVRVAGGTADLKLLRHAFTPTQQLSAGLRLKYDMDGYEASDSPRLAGMDERKGGFWGGAGATWRNPIAQVSADWMADLSGNSKGQKLQLQVERRFALGGVGVTPRVAAQWLDKKYVDYYFGVRAHEALADRPVYLGKAATTLEGGLRMDYALSGRHQVFLDLSVTGLPNEIKDSPLVDRSSLSRVAVGYLYRF